MKRISRTLAVLLTLALLFPSLPARAEEGERVVALKIGCGWMTGRIENGLWSQPVDPDNEAVVPIAWNSRTLVPVSRIVAVFGGKSGWYQSTNMAFFTLDKHRVEVTIGSAEITVDGELRTMDVAAQAMYDRTYVPLRAVLEGLGLTVGYEPENQVIVVSDGPLEDGKLREMREVGYLLEQVRAQGRKDPANVAVIVNGKEYSAADLQYYYSLARNALGVWGGYIGMEYDPAKGAGEQWYDRERGQTYADFLRETAVDDLRDVSALYAAAQAEGYVLSEEGRQTIERERSQLDGLCKQYGLSRDEMAAHCWGDGVTEEVFLRNLTESVTAEEYAQAHREAIPRDETALQEYYTAHSDELDSYEFCLFFLRDGETPAKERAESAVAELTAAQDRRSVFWEVARRYVPQEEWEEYDTNPYYSEGMGLDLLGSSAYVASWLMDGERQEGDVTAIGVPNGCYVVLFLNRYRDETPTVNIRHILFRAEGDDEGNLDQQAMAEAKAKAQAVLKEWKAGEQTVQSFAALARQYSDDAGSNTNGGQYTYVYQGQMVPGFDDWCFDPARKPGDVGLVEAGTAWYRGWHIIYFEGTNGPRWEREALEYMVTWNQEQWLKFITEGAQVVLAEGMNYVGPPNTAAVSP